MYPIVPNPEQHDSAPVRIIRNKWIQAGLAGIPFAGGPVQAYLAGVIADIDGKKWQGYWQSVEERLAVIDAQKVNFDYFATEDFIVRLRRIYSQVTEGADDAKITYLRDYLISCSMSTSMDTTWKDIFLRHIQELTGAHLRILRVFCDHQSRLSYKDRFELPQRVDGSPLGIDELEVHTGTSDSVLMHLLCSDLASRGLVSRWIGTPIEPIAWSVTDSGIKLMSFLAIS